MHPSDRDLIPRRRTVLCLSLALLSACSDDPAEPGASVSSEPEEPSADANDGETSGAEQSEVDPPPAIDGSEASDWVEGIRQAAQAVEQVESSVPTEVECVEMRRRVREAIESMEPLSVDLKGSLDPTDTESPESLRSFLGIDQLAEHYDIFTATYRSSTEQFAKRWNALSKQVSDRVMIVVREPKQIRGLDAIEGWDEVGRRHVAVLTSHKVFDKRGTRYAFQSEACVFLGPVEGETARGTPVDVPVFEDRIGLLRKAQTFETKANEQFSAAKSDYDEVHFAGHGDWLTTSADQVLAHLTNQVEDRYRVGLREAYAGDNWAHIAPTIPLGGSTPKAREAEAQSKAWPEPYLAVLDEVPLESTSLKVAEFRDGLGERLKAVREDVAAAELALIRDARKRQVQAAAMINKLALNGVGPSSLVGSERNPVAVDGSRYTFKISYLRKSSKYEKFGASFPKHCVVEKVGEDGAKDHYHLTFDLDWCLENIGK